MKKLILLVFVVAASLNAQRVQGQIGQVPVVSAPDNSPVGGAGNLTTVGSVPYVSASGILNQDAGQFFWDATNNRLGIGTATPGYALQVVGQINIPDNNSYIWGAGTSYISGSSASSFLTFNTALTERMRITSTGNVGIGTATPAQKLEVNGIGRFTGTGAFSIGDEAGALRITSNNASPQPFGLFSATNNYTGIRVGAISVGTSYGASDAPAAGMIVQGNVGIGTTTPAATLTVVNTGATAQVRFGITAQTDFGELYRSDSLGLFVSSSVASAGAKPITFATGADVGDRMVTISGNGNVLIGGTTNGNYRLDVQKSGSSGTARFYDQTASTGSTLAVFRAGVAQSGNVLEVQNNAGSNVLSITSTGSLTSNVSIVAGGNITAGATQDLSWSTRSTMTSPAGGIITLYNNAQTDFNRLQFGGTTSSFPSIQRSTTKLFFRLADDSAGATVRAGGYESSDGTAGATVTTCTGFKNGLCISGM